MMIHHCTAGEHLGEIGDYSINLRTDAMTESDIPSVIDILNSEKNKAVLHPAELTSEQWHDAFRNNLQDPDEANFIIYRSGVPVAWLKVNGLQGKMPWLSMLVVYEEWYDDRNR